MDWSRAQDPLQTIILGRRLGDTPAALIDGCFFRDFYLVCPASYGRHPVPSFFLHSTLTLDLSGYIDQHGNSESGKQHEPGDKNLLSSRDNPDFRGERQLLRFPGGLDSICGPVDFLPGPTQSDTVIPPDHYHDPNYINFWDFVFHLSFKCFLSRYSFCSSISAPDLDVRLTSYLPDQRGAREVAEPVYAQPNGYSN